MSLKQRLLSQSAVIFAARIFGAGVIFLVQAAMARIWGASFLGEYLLVMATINLLAMIVPLGFHSIGTYFAAEYAAHGNRGMLWHFFARCYGHILVVGALVIALIGPIATLFGAPGQIVADVGLPAALLAIATAIIFTNTALLVGLRRPIAGYFSELVFRPLLVLAAFVTTVAVFAGVDRLGHMMWLLAVSYLAVSLVQTGLVVARVRQIPDEVKEHKADQRRWWRFAVPWVMISLATEFFFDIDLLLLSGHIAPEDLAIFGVCARIFSLISFGVAAVYAVTLPDMFEAEAKRDRDGFHLKIGEANMVASAIALALVACVFVGGRFALSIFGPDFSQNAWPLVILSLGLLVRSVFGPATVVLSIHDRPYASLPAVAIGLASLFVFNLLLVPPMGLLGAAVAALLALVIWSAGLWLTAYRIAGVDVSLVARLRAMRHARKQEASLPGA